MKNDCELVALKNKIDFKWNTKFPINTLYLMRGYLVIDENLKEKFFDICFDAYWKDDQDLSNIESFSKLLNTLNIDNDEFFKSIKEQSIKDKLIKLTADAFEKEVFGTPTFVVNSKIFWGQDRLEYALEEINNN